LTTWRRAHPLLSFFGHDLPVISRESGFLILWRMKIVTFILSNYSERRISKFSAPRASGGDFGMLQVQHEAGIYQKLVVKY
jgi:hypothetical protein